MDPNEASEVEEAEDELREEDVTLLDSLDDRVDAGDELSG